MKKILETPKGIFIMGGIIILLTLIDIISSIIKRKKSKNVLIRIEKSFTYKEIRSQISDSIWNNLGVFVFIIIAIIKYYRDLELFNSIKESGIPYSHDENDLLVLTIMYIVLLILILIGDIFKDIYLKRVKGDIRKDGIVIWGIFYKWKRIKSYRWQENKLFIKVKMRILMFHWISERELEVPMNYKENIDKILIERQ